MVNRYITALLVVLAATGMEAQTYQQALKFALTDISYDEFIQQPEAKALEDDILYVIKAIKEASQDEKKPTFCQKVSSMPVIYRSFGTSHNPHSGVLLFEALTAYRAKCTYERAFIDETLLIYRYFLYICNQFNKSEEYCNEKRLGQRHLSEIPLPP